MVQETRSILNAQPSDGPRQACRMQREDFNEASGQETHIQLQNRCSSLLKIKLYVKYENNILQSLYVNCELEAGDRKSAAGYQTINMQQSLFAVYFQQLKTSRLPRHASSADSRFQDLIAYLRKNVCCQQSNSRSKAKKTRVKPRKVPQQNDSPSLGQRKRSRRSSNRKKGRLVDPVLQMDERLKEQKNIVDRAIRAANKRRVDSSRVQLLDKEKLPSNVIRLLCMPKPKPLPQLSEREAGSVDELSFSPVKLEQQTIRPNISPALQITQQSHPKQWLEFHLQQLQHQQQLNLLDSLY